MNDILKYLCNLQKSTASIYVKEFTAINNTKLKYGFDNFGITEKEIKKLEKFVKNMESDAKQTTLIPTNIYADFITKSLDYIDHYHSQINQIRQFGLELYSEKFSVEDYRELISHYKLDALHEAVGIENQVSSYSLFTSFQSIAAMVIMCFSGMRINELQNLPINTYSTTTYNGEKIYLLNGFTSKKTVSGLRCTTWITSDKISKAIECLKVICEIHREFYSLKKFFSGSYGKHKNLKMLELEDYPLFPSFGNTGTPQPRYGIPVTEVYQGMNNWVERLLNPINFTKEDLNELYIFNPLEDWESYEDIEIGKPWRFKTHQFRRSLTVYSIRSGLVKIPTLKKQLQHISYDMTLHYGNNEPYRVCRRVNILRDYPDDKIKIYP